MPAIKKQNKASRSETNKVALEAFFNICDLWNLNNKEQMVLLGIQTESSFFNYKKEKRGLLHKDTLERISYIIGAYKALQILFTNKEQANAWVKKPNKAFNGQSALDIMLGGNVVDLAEVRNYLDAQRGW